MIATCHTLKESEDNVCMAIVHWSKYIPILRDHLIHIANERKTSIQHHVKLKKMGVRKGVSDFFLAYPNGDYCGLWVEVKTLLKRNSKITKEQKEWINLMNYVGFIAVVTFGFEDTQKVISQYLDDPDEIEIIKYQI